MDALSRAKATLQEAQEEAQVADETLAKSVDAMERAKASYEKTRVEAEQVSCMVHALVQARSLPFDIDSVLLSITPWHLSPRDAGRRPPPTSLAWRGQTSSLTTTLTFKSYL